MRILRLFAAALLLTSLGEPHDIITTNLTFTRDISRIFAVHCLPCHGAGTSIPLTSYEEVRPWAVSIKEQVLSRSMPPWGAVKGFGAIAHDQGLSQEDLTIIAAWVIGGAPKGNAQLLPPTTPQTKAPSAAPAQQLQVIETRAVLTHDIQVTAIRPLPKDEVGSAKVVARLPDGRVVPLVWLYRFDPKLPRSYAFRKPLSLVAGTLVESSAPLRFALESSLPPKSPALKVP